MKTCSRCHTSLDESLFAKSSKSKDGFRGWCKKCESDYQKSRKSDPEYLAYKRAAMKKYYLRHREKVLERNAKYAEENRETLKVKYRDRIKKWNIENYKNNGWLIRIRKRISNRVSYICDPESRRDKLKKFKENNPDYFKNWSKKYAEKYPEKAKASRFASNERRRMAESVVGDSPMTKEQWLSVMKESGWQCEHCGSSKLLCVDHFFPLSYGFPLSVANYAILCKSCNSKKHTKLPSEFPFSKAVLDRKRVQFLRNGAYEYAATLDTECRATYVDFIES